MFALTRRSALGRVLGVTVGVVGAAMSACGPAAPGSPPTGTKQKITIQYWNKWGGSSKVPEEAVIALFQERFPHITVEGLEDAQIGGEGRGDREKFFTALAANTPPEAIKIDRFMMGGHGARRTTEVLDDRIKRDKIDMKKFFSATVDEVLYPPGPGGKITALPWNTDDRALYYNKKHFVEAGLDPNKPPRTWEEAQDMGIRLSQRDATGLKRAGFVAWGANTNWSIGWHWSAGGQWLKAGPDARANRRAAFNDDRGVRMLQYALDNVNKVLGGFADYEQWRMRWGPREQSAWFNDGISMGVTGVWELGNFRTYGAHVDFGVTPAPRPRGMEGTTTTWAGGFALAVPVGMKKEHADAGWEFVKFYCYTKEPQLLFGSRTGQMPALMEAAEDKAYKESDPRMPVFVDLMKNAKIRDVTPAGDDVWFCTRDRRHSIFCLNDRVYNGEFSVKDALAEAEKHVNRTLDEAWAKAGG